MIKFFVLSFQIMHLFSICDTVKLQVAYSPKFIANKHLGCMLYAAIGLHVIYYQTP